MQWAAALGWVNIMYDTVVISRYHPSPCKYHLSKIHNIYGYLKTYTSTSIKFNTKTLVYDDCKTIEGG